VHLKLFHSGGNVSSLNFLAARDAFRYMLEMLNVTYPVNPCLYEIETQIITDVSRRVVYTRVNIVCVTAMLCMRRYASRDVSRYICAMVRAEMLCVMQAFTWRLFGNHGYWGTEFTAMCCKAIQRGFGK
jgi:hypothetical protein